MNDQSRRQRGYSLAEVLVALAIFAIIFLAALTAYDRSNRVFRTGVESSNMQQNTRVAFDKLVGDLRMAGYDFDRDGIPTGSTGGLNQYQQPDEQFEYIGPAAMTIRGNFDYETENQPCTATVTDNCDNGREETYESTQFPVVTTGNDEIVTYALVPDSQVALPACNPATNCVQFYADTHVPRKSYPDVPNGGLDENLVEITGVDLCTAGCNNPPYTLYRFTLDRSQQNFTGGLNVTRTPLASNIRSIQYTYYQDAQGTDPLKDLNNTVDVSTGAAIAGKGQFKVANPLALVPERDVRSKINSVRVTLIGMNESRDAAYTDTAETLTGGPGFFQQYRKYRLETLVSPRNIQKRGMREQDTFPPGAPTSIIVCTGACAGVYMSWTAPAVNAVQGAPDQYKVIYDLASAPGFTCETTTYTNTFGHVFYQPSMSPSCKIDPTQSYKFAVVALNSYGSATSGQVTAQPLNSTKQNAPTLVSATNNQNGKVTLTWTRPTTNFSGSYSCGPQAPPAAELQGYLVERESPTGSGNWVQLLPSGGQVTTTSPYDTVTWTDTTAANCVPYTYRLRAIEECLFHSTWNAGGVATLGRSPQSNEVAGLATTTLAPAAPSNLIVDQDPTNSPCVGLICNVHMHFPPVNTDVAMPTGNPITITKYTVLRRQVGVTGFLPVPGPVPTLTNPPVNAIGEIEFIDNNVDTSAGQLYEYEIVAHSDCPTPFGTDSAPSTPRPYPCSFPVGVVGSPLIQVSAFDGDGSQANPYKIATGTNAVAVINVTSPAAISRVVGRGYIGTTLKWGPAQCPVLPCSSPNPPFAFGWALAANATERLDVAVVETGGCVEQSTAYFEDEPQNCCLLPTSFDPTVISFSSGNNFVDFVLKNVCGQPLTITGLTFTWSAANTPGGTKADAIWFQTTSGGCAQTGLGPNCAAFNFGGSGVGAGTYTLLPANIPGNTATVGAGATTTKIRVHFSKSLTNPIQPVTSFSVNYTDANNPGGTLCPLH
ncbi:MAG TPA: prepilin-type N-terminal cleavage/methylation domain-containing protein [Thermoanaerobaculia bacterium]|nr:prepilin-type N-terminal cleavage/methylation domain-containing protein [Thermoanaerobaculia bacterium]